MAAKTQHGRRAPISEREQQPALRPDALDWNDVRVLLALSRDASLRGAAQALGVNASTVGRRLEALEAALATRLFDRTREGLRATAATEQLLAHAERVEHAALSLVSAAEGFERAPEGVVRISAPPGVADHFVAPALGRLLERYPGLRIELDASIGYSDLSRREADLALRTSRPQAGDLIATKLLERRELILGSPAYVRELGTLTRFEAARWLAWGHDLAQLPSTRFVLQHVPQARIVMRSSSINALLGAAESGLGLLVMSEAYAKLRPLVPVKLSPKLQPALRALPQLPLWLVGHRALREVPRIAAVWSFITESLVT